MVNFAAKHFRKVLELSLWLNLIVCIIVGWNIGSAGRHPVIGALLGLLVGMLTSIIEGGLLSVFLNIDKGVKNINKWLQCYFGAWQHHIDANAKLELPKPLYDDDIYYFD